VENPVENLKSVEKIGQTKPSPNFHKPNFSTACGKVENHL
jgi:hypothetical protein